MLHYNQSIWLFSKSIGYENYNLINKNKLNKIIKNKRRRNIIRVIVARKAELEIFERGGQN
jgi:hypothetical protein